MPNALACVTSRAARRPTAPARPSPVAPAGADAARASAQSRKPPNRSPPASRVAAAPPRCRAVLAGRGDQAPRTDSAEAANAASAGKRSGQGRQAAPRKARPSVKHAAEQAPWPGRRGRQAAEPGWQAMRSAQQAGKRGQGPKGGADAQRGGKPDGQGPKPRVRPGQQVVGPGSGPRPDQGGQRKQREGGQDRPGLPVSSAVRAAAATRPQAAGEGQGARRAASGVSRPRLGGKRGHLRQEVSTCTMNTDYALLTDLYQLTMAQGYWETRARAPRRRASICTSATIPSSGGYAIACGMDQLAELVEGFAFTAEDVDYLACAGRAGRRHAVRAGRSWSTCARLRAARATSTRWPRAPWCSRTSRSCG